MAPAKNPNAANKTSSNSNSQNHNIPSSSAVTTNAANSHTTYSSASQRKHTGTVPKPSAKSTAPNANPTAVGGGQKLLLQSSGMTQMANRCSPLNIVASVQQHNTRTQQQHKNTEIVAPIRRELKDLNDYLLTTVVTTAANHNNNNSLNNTQQLQQLQTSIVQQQQNQNYTNTASTNSDLESSQENQQRFCYPVRPIPRRNQQQSQQHNTQQTQSDFLNSTQNTNLNTAIGVVIPTTPGLPTVASNTTTTQSITSIQPVVTSNTTNTTVNDNLLLGPQFEQHLQLLVVQRLKQLFENSQSQPFLNLTANLLPNIQTSTSANLANAVLSQNTNEFNQLAQRFQQTLLNSNNNQNQKINLDNTLQNQQQQKVLKSSSMVHEINPNTTPREVVVNSTSLEDVPLSEASDRAQSIQSLHSNIETPTPDTTPSYEELQQRLEASNRNIQNMQEQQQQLLKLQNAAKQHLSDMEKFRQQAQPLSFPAGGQHGADGGDGAPEYESIEQVHSDMNALVGRMKNLTSFIHNQNELSSLMGDDGPEILAEQELLQRKLEALRAQRDEMRNLVSELQNVNRSAEETAKEARQRQYEQEKDVEENDLQTSPKHQEPEKKASNLENEREVLIEFSRNVPIELLQQAQRQQSANTNGHHIQSESEVEEDEEQRKIAAALIQQKVADIDAMKAQLKRLKDMMETVNIIEANTAKDPKLIGLTPPQEIHMTFDRERTPIAVSSRYQDDSSQDEFIARKVRMLNEVTSDLRAQAQSLQSEKDRIQALKNEIERRKQQAAAAAQIGEEALKRSSLTPTPVPRNHESRWEEHVKTQQERDQLKEEYEVKKKEFELLCKRLDQEEQQQPTPTRRQDIVSEADDEAEEDNNDSDYAASTKFVPPTSTPAAKRANEPTSRNIKDSLNSTGASSNAATHIAQAASSTHDGASLEAASIQSGSSRSFSIPPPMSAMGMNFPGPIPPPLPTAWNPHQYYYATGVPPPPLPPQAAFVLNPTTNNTATLTTSECICNANNLGAATSSSTATSAVTNAPIVNNEPMLQQFIQTQQMLISSVCQCNQMLWHQQREIDSLNQTIHMLQERLLSLTAGNINSTNNANDVQYGLRSESVPPHSLAGIPSTQALPNNLYVGINRAQSEQPIPFIPGQNRNSAFSNYQQQQHQHVYRHQQRLSQPQGGYNFNTETQQHNSSATASSSMYATLNNAVPPQPSQAPSTHFNNEIPTPQSPVVGSGPAPIFMHHHNNAIHQNNANLRTQNQQQQQHHHHSNISHTLNNQVPPGNRANNYWDNFRSYSRQNLLSTNSAKSNEEQQMQQQQQETQFERPTSMPHQQQQHPSYNFHQQNLDECSNNLNYAANNESANSAQNKYLRIMQRSRINQQHQQQQYQQNVYQQQRDFLQQLNWLEEHENSANNTNSSNTVSNTADLMYHNYNIHQSNKVGPKPNWRFRNLNEEYNTPTPTLQQQNSRHTTQVQPLQRYQNTLTFQQQQQQQQRLQHFLNLPQQHQQTTTPTTQGRNQDFLLRTAAMEIDVGEANYNFLNTQQQLPLDFSNPQQPQNNDNMILNGNENNEEDDEEEDDTTSEEIKRNLLVNALKNDKFTTKFYESIKEDVFRRLESMLLDKGNVNNETIVSNTGQQQQQQQNLHFNNISNISLRKLNLNELLQQQQHQQHNQQFQNPFNETLAQNSHEENEHISMATAIKNESEQPHSSSNNDNDNENEKPEEDANWRQNIINNCNNPKQSSSNNGTTITDLSSTVNTTALTKNITKKRKNVRKQCPNHQTNNVNASLNANEEDGVGVDNLRGACSLAAQQHQKLQQETKDKQNDNKNETNISSTTTSPKSTPSGGSLSSGAKQHHHSTESDLIKYIINRIRNQTHTNTLINDALLVDVAKLTATVAQNAQPLTHNINLGNNTNTISPKKIYAKIKKLSLPKERDEFLRWYQKYLENTLFGNQRQHQQHSADKNKSSATKMANNQLEQQQRQNDLQPPTNDDGDLAEADQNCSLNNSGGSCNAADNKNVNAAPYQQTFSENNAQDCVAVMLIKTEPSSNGSIECENNENPDEAFSLSVEDNRESSLSNSSESANDKTKADNLLQTVMNLKANETLKPTTKEKSDLKCEKPEFNEKE